MKIQVIGSGSMWTKYNSACYLIDDKIIFAIGIIYVLIIIWTLYIIIHMLIVWAKFCDPVNRPSDETENVEVKFCDYALNKPSIVAILLLITKL